MWAAILKVFYEIIATIIKNQSGPITSVAAPVVPADIRKRWNKRVRDWQESRVRARE